MSAEKYTAIKQYLAEHFPGCEIEERHDFDRGAQSFKIQVAGTTLLLKVGDEFVGDNDIAEIIRIFELGSIAEILGKGKNLGVLVTQRGVEPFNREQH